MGQLRVLSGVEICLILGQNGFKKVRQRGSHVVMQLKLDTTTVTVPVPHHDPVKIGTLRWARPLPDIDITKALHWRGFWKISQQIL